MEFLEVINQTMTVTEAKVWFTETWTIPSSIPGIPLSDGWICFLCQYSCIEKSSMRSHCSLEHKGLNAFSQSASCKVQKIFYHYIPVSEPFTTSIIWGLWGL